MFGSQREAQQPELQEEILCYLHGVHLVSRTNFSSRTLAARESEKQWVKFNSLYNTGTHIGKVGQRPSANQPCHHGPFSY